MARGKEAARSAARRADDALAAAREAERQRRAEAQIRRSLEADLETARAELALAALELERLRPIAADARAAAMAEVGERHATELGALRGALRICADALARGPGFAAAEWEELRGLLGGDLFASLFIDRGATRLGRRTARSVSGAVLRDEFIDPAIVRKGREK